MLRKVFSTGRLNFLKTMARKVTGSHTAFQCSYLLGMSITDCGYTDEHCQEPALAFLTLQEYSKICLASLANMVAYSPVTLPGSLEDLSEFLTSQEHFHDPEEEKNKASNKIT